MDTDFPVDNEPDPSAEMLAGIGTIKEEGSIRDDDADDDDDDDELSCLVRACMVGLVMFLAIGDPLCFLLH